MRGIIKRKKGVSPMVSTVLLIMIVIIIAIIILIWGRGWIKEKLLKFNKPVENVCPDVSIKPFVNPDNSYGFTNTGNIPIYQVDLKITARGSSSVTRIDKSANPGASVILGNDYGDSNIEEIKIIPVLLGKTSSGKQKQYTCPEQTAVVV
jgi:flagellin-like protein